MPCNCALCMAGVGHRAGLILAAVIAGCVPAQAAQGSACREQGRAIISTARTCREAVAQLEELVVRSPECAAILNDDAGAGVHCKGDGGP